METGLVGKRTFRARTPPSVPALDDVLHVKPLNVLGTRKLLVVVVVVVVAVEK